MIHTTVYHPRSGELVGGGVQRSETVVNMPIREGTFFIWGGGVGGGLEYLRIFWRKKSWPSHSVKRINAPKQKHLTLPLPILDKNNRK